MATGLLVVEGTLDIQQFWPVGESDADTTKVVVDVQAGAFKFRAHPDAPFQVTHAFDEAMVKGKATKPAIKNGKLTIRLQGIDAPELHYRPVAAVSTAKQNAQQKTLWKKWNHDFRQPLSPDARQEAVAHLAAVGLVALQLAREQLLLPDDTQHQQQHQPEAEQ